MQEIDNYIPYGPEWTKYVSRLRKAKIIEMLSKKGIECLKLKDELVQYKPAPDVPEITVEEFYTNTFNLSFLTPEEIQTIYTATELYARGKVRAALSRYAGEGGMKWVLKEQLTDIRNNLYENMPAGDVQAWDLIIIIRNHLEKLDAYIDSLPEPPLATTTG